MHVTWERDAQSAVQSILRNYFNAQLGLGLDKWSLGNARKEK